MLLILDIAAVTQVTVDTTGRDLDGDTIVTLSNAQRQAIQDKFIAKRAATKAIVATWP